jgi:hypothetical protein
MVELNTIWDEVVKPINSRKYIVFNGKFGFNFCNVSQESKPGIKQNLPV